MTFDIHKWNASIARYLPGVRYIGTKVTDPMVRWSERRMGPLAICGKCAGAFTHMGLPRHVRACKAKRSNVPAREAA